MTTTSITLAKAPPLLLLLASGAASWFAIEHVPPAVLFVYLGAAIGLDLVTGLMKSWKKGEVTSSIGFRATVTKLVMYSAVIIGAIIIVNVTGMNGGDYTVPPGLMTWLMTFLIFIEIYSVFENVSEAYPDSLLTKYVIDPILTLLRGKLNNSNHGNSN